MKTINSKYFVDRADWRQWLLQNFEKEDEIWLEYPKKSSGKARIVYNDAVEEALCFGWIDSIVKSLDAQTTIQRFSKRRARSTFSQANIERLKWLAENNLLHPTVAEQHTSELNQVFLFPKDILSAIQKNGEAWKNYQNFSEPYKRIRVAYIEAGRKRPEEFDKRLRNFIAKCQENRLIKGFGGIDKYY